jgi:hypothetical protein
MTTFPEWQFAIRMLRLAHVAAGKDWWRNCVELYASEAQHLWSPV